jgi:hypothetical protein
LFSLFCEERNEEIYGVRNEARFVVRSGVRSGEMNEMRLEA